MSKHFLRFAAIVSIALVIDAQAETVVPAQGQTPDQMQKDVADCQAQGKAVYDQTLAANQPATTDDKDKGGRLRGAAVGAAAGAAAGQVRSNQYDNVSSDAQQEYRQNQAKDAAVAGAVVGGAQQRQSRREDKKAQQQQADAAAKSADAAQKQAYSGCLTGKGYTVNP